MTTIALGTLSIFGYLISTLLLGKDTLHNTSSKTAIIPGCLAVCLHFSYIFFTLNLGQNFNFNVGIINSASFVSSLVAALLLLATLSNPVEKLGLIIFPLAALTLILSLIFPTQELNLRIKIDSWQMGIHIFSSIIAFSLLNIAAIQAILLAYQEQQLRKHPPKRFIQTLPSLQTMETLLFHIIAVGLLFLTLSLVSGFIFLEDLFAQHLVHKTVLSLIAWVTFSSLLVGKRKYGWRGQTAVKWTLAGFILLLLAYFGSKFVLEIILNKM